MDDYLKAEFRRILQAADAIEILPDEDGKRRALADLINEYDLRAKNAHHIRNGAVILRSPEGSNYSVLSKVLQAQTSGIPAVEAIDNIRKAVHKATTFQVLNLDPGSSPLEYIFGPYDTVNNKYAYESCVVKDGSVLVNIPTLDYDFKAYHQPIIKDGAYCGMNTETYIVSNERNCPPEYEMFEMMASAILQYMPFSTIPNLKEEAMALYSQTWEADFFENLYLQAMVGGLAYNTPWYWWISEMPSLDSADSDNIALWPQHIAKILKGA